MSSNDDPQPDAEVTVQLEPPSSEVAEAPNDIAEAPIEGGGHDRVDAAFAKWHDEREPSPGFMPYNVALATAAALARELGRGELDQTRVHVLLSQYEVPIVAHHMHMTPQAVAPGMLHGAGWIFDVGRNGCRPRNEPDYPEKWLWLEVDYDRFFVALHAAGIIEAVPGDVVAHRDPVADGGDMHFVLAGYDDQGVAHLRIEGSDEFVDAPARGIVLVRSRVATSAPTPAVAAPRSPSAPLPSPVELGAGELGLASAHVCRTCGARPTGALMNIDGPVPVPVGWKMLGVIAAADGPSTLIEFCGTCVPVLRNL